MTALCRMTNERVRVPCSYAGCPLFGDCLVAYEKGTEKSKTNADHIRSMTDEELAAFVVEPHCDRRTTPECKSFHGDCIACGLDWLKQPYKEAQ